MARSSDLATRYDVGIASTVIDLTGDSDEGSTPGPRPRRIGLPRTRLRIDHIPIQVPAPASSHSTNYAVSVHYHEPWTRYGEGDTSSFLGVYATLEEAKHAAQARYREEMKKAYGWTFRWKHYGEELLGNEELRLNARRQDAGRL